MYNDPACKPWTSRQWAPLGYSSRQEVARETQKQDERKLEEAAEIARGSDETHLDDKDGLRNKATKA
jgi:hypothetical protein